MEKEKYSGSHVKVYGIEKEIELANLLNGTKTIKNTQKYDVIDNQGYRYSCKAGIKKIQFFCYFATNEGNLNDGTFEGSSILMNLLVNLNKSKTKKGIKEKELIKETFIKFREYLDIRFYGNLYTNKFKFLYNAIFNNKKTDYLAIHKDGIYYIFNHKYVINTIYSYSLLGTSHGTGKDLIDAQTLNFKYLPDYTKKPKDFGKLEIRMHKIGQYSIAFNCYTQDILNILLSHLDQGISIEKPYKIVNKRLYYMTKLVR